MARTDVILPQYNVSDDEYVMVDILVENEAYIEKGQEVAVFEGSKAAYEIEAPVSGYISFNSKIGEVVKVNEPFAEIFDSLEEAKEKLSRQLDKTKVSINISTKAKRLIDENNIDIKVFEGKDIVRESDVAKYLVNSQKDEKEIIVNERSLIIFGIGTQADVAYDAVVETGSFDIVAYVDYEASLDEKDNIPVISRSHFSKLLNTERFSVYVCLPERKLEHSICTEVKASQSNLVSIISKSASVSERAIIGENVFIGPKCVVGPFVELQQGVRMLNGASVAHHSVIGTQTWISDGASIGGNVVIGANCLFGLNSSVNKRVTIGEKCIINSNVNISTNQKQGSFLR